MARYKRGVIHFSRISEDDTALLGHFGDKEAFDYLWVKAMDKVDRVAGLFCRRYAWIDHDDLSQEILSGFPKIVRRYRPDVARAKGVSWDKYLYFSFYRAAQDALRREDPLGVMIPQKAHYPTWRRLSEISDEVGVLEHTIIHGLERIDRGEESVLDGEIRDENNCVAPTERSPDYHDRIYHGKLPWARGDSH